MRLESAGHPELALRSLAPDDAAELIRIHTTPEVQEWWDVPEEGFPWNDDPDTTRFVIEVDGAVAGLIEYWEDTEPKYRHAGIDVFLDPALRGRGLGTEGLPDKTDTSLRVMTWNTAGEATSSAEIARFAVGMQADVVTLPETTIETGADVAEMMREMGRPMWAHHAEYGEYGITGWDATSTTVLIRPELGDYSVIQSSLDGSSNTSTVPSAVAMPVSGDGPIIVAAHAVAPRQEYMTQWRSDLQWLADQCASDNVILAGDFNATLDHMTGMGVDGGTLGRCHDAASASGNGGVGTWPTDAPALLGAPIDHVMATPDWTVSGSVVMRSLDGSGSDHRPIVVQLERTGG